MIIAVYINSASADTIMGITPFKQNETTSLAILIEYRYSIA